MLIWPLVEKLLIPSLYGSSAEAIPIWVIYFAVDGFSGPTMLTAPVYSGTTVLVALTIPVNVKDAPPEDNVKPEPG
jgi:hypothetical protein